MMFLFLISWNRCGFGLLIWGNGVSVLILIKLKFRFSIVLGICVFLLKFVVSLIGDGKLILVIWYVSDGGGVFF